MGVPKFFRYISERYPCLSELAREQFIPDFDNLYLDMNGIIHNCSHPDDSNIHFNITEEDMFTDIFHYVNKLFFLIRPQKLFFMAIDGVAPRAKMNQQRCRRFRTAKEAEILKESAITRGEEINHERFDSNCITPGTEFMERLHEALRYFIKSRISTDPLWQRCRVILSGHNAPGEGEHKIMDYIRYLKSQSDYNPNTRHCLYGLDADLIILGLCTHEPHFVVLREEVKFGKKTKKTSVEETRFFLLHLGLLREYLELEFDEIKQQDANFNIANLIDDWVLMGFLVGNDFIPHLPCMHISSNALPLLYKTYKKVYGSLGGNINENGKLNLPRLEKYFAALAEVEFDLFQENYADLKYFAAKQSKNGIDEAFDFDVNEITNENIDSELAALIENSRQFLEDDDEDLSDNEQHINEEFNNYKRDYYMNKLNKDNSNSELAKEQATCYVRALQWILDYYYRGVQSWDWYYPYHYAPFISDLKGFQDYEIKFNLGKPFLPFQQLLAVLPAASRSLLPAAYRDLMTSASSELIDYYPKDFQTDLNGKQHEWEAVVLIPFIDEKILLDAMAACDENLTPSERKRNQHGPMLQYDYNPESQGPLPGINLYKSLPHVFCTEKPFWSKDILVSPLKTFCVELPNAARTEFFPGFPTMRHLKYKFEIKNARVQIFNFPSRNPVLVLQPLKREDHADIYAVAEKYLNQTVYIGWPHLAKAKVVGISNAQKYIDVDGVKDLEPKVFDFKMKIAEEHSFTRMGIEFPDYSVLVHVRIYTGISLTCGTQGKVSASEVWSKAIIAYPAQGVVSAITVHPSATVQHKKIEQLFPENSKIFFVGNPYYGSEGIVMNPLLFHECGRIQVNITVLPEPNFEEATTIQAVLAHDYVNTYQAAAAIGINARILGRITGCVLVIKGAKRPKADLPENLSKLNIGLQFKFIKQHEELAGYAQRIDNQWFFSSKAIELVQLYITKFPLVIECMSRVSERSEWIFEEDLFPAEVGEKKLEEIVAWIKEQEHMKAERVACGSKTLEKQSVERILEAIEYLKTLPVKTVKLQVKPHLLLKPDVSLPDAYKPKNPIQLFDRVVIVKTTYMVPLGSKGTVVGIYPVSDPNPVRLECVKAVDYFYDVLFDKQIPNGHDIHGIAHQRVYKVPESSILLVYTEDSKRNKNLKEFQISAPAENKADVTTNSWRNSENVSTLNSGVNSSDVTTNSWRNSGNVNTVNSSDVTVNSWRSPRNVATTSSSDVIPNSWRNQGSVNSANSSAMKAITAEMKQAQITQKDGHNFWMPAANTKQKHCDSMKLTQNPLNHANEARAQLTAQAPAVAPQECNDGTQLLKSLLGLSSQTAATGATVTQSLLPQPPTSWRADAQKLPILSQTFHNMSLPQNSKSFPPSAPMSHIGANIFSSPFAQNYPNSKYQQSPQLQFQPAYSKSSPSTNFQQQNANGPQDKSFNSNSLSKKGAFIPLQVSRGSFATASQKPTSLPARQSDTSSSTNNVNAQNMNDLALQRGQATANFNQQQQHMDIKPTYKQKKPPRVPKIGAKFDFAN